MWLDEIVKFWVMLQGHKQKVPQTLDTQNDAMFEAGTT